MSDTSKTTLPGKRLGSVGVLAILLAMLVALGMVAGFSLPAYAAGETTVLAFTSDVHNGGDNKSTNNLSANRTETWITKMKALYNHIDVMAFGGDMGSAYRNCKDFWDYSQDAMERVDAAGITGVYTTGNHEYNPGDGQLSNGALTSASNPDMASKYIVSQQGAVGSNYRIYCLGAASSSSDYSSQITSLESYLSTTSNDRPIFIITHFPLHYFSGRNTSSASTVIDKLNDAVTNNGQKIIFLWGHNHTMSDKYYDQIYAPGDSIQYGSSNSNTKTINFYYAAAGCMSDSEYGTGSAYVKGKGLIVTINDKQQLTFTYYDENGNNVTEGGTYTEQDPVPVTGVTINTPATTTVEVGKTLTLSATVAPAEATNKTVAWSSSDTSVAKVDSSGKVKGVSAGTAIITATSNDKTNNPVPADSIEITIVPRSGNEPSYVLTNTLVPGKDYIIANKNSGEACALTNNSGSVGKTSVEIDGDTIYTEDTSIVFTATGSGSSVTAISNGNRYLSAGSNNLTLASSAPSNVTFAYGSDSKLTCKSGNNTYYIYYSTYNNGRFTTSTSASSTSSPREMYLFAKVEGQVPATGISVSPKTASVEVGKTTQLTAALSPSNSTDKVAWASNNTSIATVSESGVVTGVAAGSATITANAGNTSDTCTVTVTAGHTHTYGSPTWRWTSNNSSATATFTCTANDDTKTVTDNNPVETVVTEATCEANKVIKYTATVEFGGQKYSTSTDNVTVANSALGHQWDTRNVTWTWTGSDANGWTAATAKLTCTRNSSHTTTETATISTKTEGNTTTYTATVTVGGTTVTDTKVVTSSTPVHTHSYGAAAYNWTKVGNGWTCTATMTCSTCSEGTEGHTVTEAGTVTSKVTTAATCEGKGKTTYTATFTNSAFTTQTRVEEDVAALGHSWGTPNYAWATDNSSVAATRTCSNDSSHKQTETVNTTYAVTTSAACETAGVGTYTATFTNTAFSQQTKTVSIPATGHSWNAPTYAWTKTANGYRVTATQTCANDAAGRHSLSETVSATYAVTTPATCEAEGVGTYTATFSNSAYVTQTMTEPIAAIGHSWGAPTYEWAADNSTVTATRVCANDSNHKQTETVNTNVVTSPATCEAAGQARYTATFRNEAFTSQTKTITIPAKGHSWGAPTYTWATDYSSVTATRVCGNDSSHKQTETAAIDPSKTVRVEPTDTTDGSITYTTKSFSNEAFAAQTITVAIPATGHVLDYDNATWTWTGSDTRGWTAATATVKCKANDGYSLTADATIAVVTTAATCLEDGKMVYTATAVFDGATITDSKTVSIPATGHAWNDPTYAWATDNSTVTATRTCANDISHKQTETSTTTTRTEATTCEAAGRVTYTAIFQNMAFTAQTKEVIVPATGHNYQLSGWEWSASYDVATATFVCANDASHVVTVEDADVESTVVEPTQQADGSATFTAKVTGPDGKEYTASETVVIKATGYTVSFVDEDGKTILQAARQYAFGDTPSYDGATPTKAAAGRYTYTFAGWSDGTRVYAAGEDLPAVTSDVTYTAAYDQVAKEKWVRLEGTDRYKTMQAIVTEGFTRSNEAVLATGEKFPDALVASSVAGALDCPVVLTKTGELSGEARAVFKNLGVSHVWIMGDKSSVSDNVLRELDAMHIDYDSIAGTNRQETSLIAMQKLDRLMGEYDGTVVIASGYSFPDALAIGPWCYRDTVPILLADMNGELSDAQWNALAGTGMTQKATKVVILGGTDRVSQETRDKAVKLVGKDNVTSLAGEDRYQTAAKIAAWEISDQGMTVAHATMATGKKFPDALAGAALCGKNESVLLLADEDKDTGNALSIVSANRNDVVLGYVLGDKNSVSVNLYELLNVITGA